MNQKSWPRPSKTFSTNVIFAVVNDNPKIDLYSPLRDEQADRSDKHTLYSVLSMYS